jgi:hypothetical protein
MYKQFKKIKIFMIFVFLIFSSLLFISPSGKSGPLDEIYECYPIIEVSYNEALSQEPIIPYDEPRKINFTLYVRVGGPTADIVVSEGVGGLILILDLSIVSVPEGCHASINPPIVQVKPSVDFKTTNATIYVTVNKYVPALSLKNIVVGINTRRLGTKLPLVRKINITKTIPFIVGYLPQLSFKYKNGNVRNIIPDQAADFIVEMQNWGNADTKVNTEILDLPEGWSANIVGNTTLGTILTRGPPATVNLRVKPPINFGYHEDRAIIKVKMTPVYYNDSSYSGEPHYLYFIVQSKGFSSPGFETITILLAAILVFYPIWKRKNKTRGRKR